MCVFANLEKHGNMMAERKGKISYLMLLMVASIKDSFSSANVQQLHTIRSSYQGNKRAHAHNTGNQLMTVKKAILHFPMSFKSFEQNWTPSMTDMSAS